MDGPLQRLYKTKLAFLAYFLTVSGIGLLVLAQVGRTTTGRGWHLLSILPVGDIGSALFTTGLIGVALQYLDAKDGDERANQRLRKVLKEEAPAIRDAVVDGFAFSPEALTSVASAETLEKVVRNCLALQLENTEMANDLYTDLRDEAMTPVDRRYDSRVHVTLSRWTEGPASGRGSMFVATVRREYRGRLAGSVLRFSCVSNAGEYQTLLRDPGTTDVWHFIPTEQVGAESAAAFELIQVTVDGKTCLLRRTSRRGAQSYTARLTDRDNFPRAEVLVSYTYRVLVQQHSHLLYLDVGRPSRGFEAHLSYDGCGISYMNALEFLAGPQATRVSRMPGTDGDGNVTISYDGWVFPKSGITFCWVLNRELDQSAAA